MLQKVGFYTLRGEASGSGRARINNGQLPFAPRLHLHILVLVRSKC
jgi:hypothetical protein